METPDVLVLGAARFEEREHAARGSGGGHELGEPAAPRGSGRKAEELFVLALVDPFDSVPDRTGPHESHRRRRVPENRRLTLDLLDGQSARRDLLAVGGRKLLSHLRSG